MYYETYLLLAQAKKTRNVQTHMRYRECFFAILDVENRRGDLYEFLFLSIFN